MGRGVGVQVARAGMDSSSVWSCCLLMVLGGGAWQVSTRSRSDVSLASRSSQKAFKRLQVLESIVFLLLYIHSHTQNIIKASTQWVAWLRHFNPIDREVLCRGDRVQDNDCALLYDKLVSLRQCVQRARACARLAGNLPQGPHRLVFGVA